MRKLIYHVATSIDGFIAQEKDDIDLFPTEGDHIQDYVQSLTKYDLVIMGRRTYEFGYRYGLKPGENPYPHMKTYVYSSTLKFAQQDPSLSVIQSDALAHIKDLKRSEGDTVYLCGGGLLATHLLNHQVIDEIHIKFCPIVIGQGIPLFTEKVSHATLDLLRTKTYTNGVILLEYRVPDSK